ncbi:MAG: TSUP family transporter [Prosthecobacter sp.]|uniref:TSUP family transporter n=1 Tax=Prosthecobacter sp. TaxID=1965333 RepID=UPI00261FE2DD|nr:TSUP family transporter [Prosthecobacter sp.]MCF7789831.1 TSUP family transporter [Prosthecobacter sp.]
MMSWETITLLFFAGLSAGFIDAIAGGGGLISVPALLWAGLPPQMALGTNKMQSTWGTLMAVRKYAKAGLVSWSQVRLTVCITFVSAMSGALVLMLISNAVLKMIVPWMLLGIAVYVLLSPGLGKTAAKARLSLGTFACLAGSVLGFYDGFFGPGTGTFWTMSCIALLGLELTRATAFTKVANLTSNMASLIIFVLSARVNYEVAGVMIAGQLIGGRLGAGMAIRHGAPFIRIIFISVVLTMVAKLLWDQFV